MTRTIVLFALIHLASCKNRSAQAVWGFASKSLAASNEVILDETAVMLHAIDDAVKDPQTTKNATVWHPRAAAIHGRSVATLAYCTDLNKRLAALKEDDDHAAGNILDTAAGTLYNQLLSYRDDVLKVLQDADTLSFRKIMDRQFKIADTTDSRLSAADWSARYLRNVSPALASLFLDKLHNDLLLSENAMIAYCRKNATYINRGHEWPVPMTTLSSNYVKQGDSIQVWAGIGLFRYPNGLRITINGKQVAMNNGVTLAYTLRAPAQPGTYYVPVKFSFENDYGSSSSMFKKLRYTVLP